MPDTFAGARVKAADFPIARTASDSTALLDISSTSFIAGSPVVELTFVAPTSGTVLVTVGLGAKDNSATNRVHLAPEIYLGTSAGGTLFLSADVTTRGVGSTGTAVANHYRSRTTLLTGLTAGSTYYARTMHKVSGGATADIATRDITITPCPLGGGLAGSVVSALDFPPAQWEQDTTAINNPTGATYVTGTPTVDVTFTAPTSGAVLLIVGGGLGNSANANRIFLAPQVFIGVDATGTLYLSPTVVTRGLSSDRAANGFHYGSRESILDGLTPGATYYVRLMYAVAADGGASTGDIAAREVIVVPIP